MFKILLKWLKKSRVLQEAVYLSRLVYKSNVHNVTKEGGCQNKHQQNISLQFSIFRLKGAILWDGIKQNHANQQ